MRASRTVHLRHLMFASVLGALTAACSGRGDDGHKAPTGASSTSGAIGKSTKLEGDVVARVGETNIDRATVLGVARAQHLSADDAARTLVAEALLAEAARRNGAATDPRVKQSTTAAVGKALIARFRDDALAQGEITDAELNVALTSGEEWIELDRPETRRAAHALVPKDVPDGEAIAKRLRDAVVAAPDVESFLQSARAFAATTGLPAGKIVVESLGGPFTEDGRVAQHGGGTFAVPFTQAAFQMAKVGDTSDVVWNPEFGWHVIRLLAIEPPVHASRDELVAALRGSVINARIGSKFQDLVQRLYDDAHVKLLFDDATLMAPRFSAP